mmetsp:Transcript_8638/g.26889  ORF Transcript_8638/g.26889 Transcript_8638/m.26889 type:complete len:212 (-) Transcript_8638:680-1315(-)
MPSNSRTTLRKVDWGPHRQADPSVRNDPPGKHRCVRPRSLAAGAPPELQQKRGEDDAGPHVGEGSQLVPEDDRGEDHGEHLAGGHDQSEDHRAELPDRAEDEQLADGAGQGDGHVVQQRGGVLHYEIHRHPHLPRGQEGRERQHDRPRVRHEHHLELVHLWMVRVDARLPLRRERVGRKVQHQHEHAEQRSLRGAATFASSLGEGENGDAD